MLPYRELSELNFLEVLIAIVISWIIIDLWLRVIENFAYRTIGLSEKSTIHTLVVALVVTIIFITFVFSVPGSVTDLIIGETYTEEDVYGVFGGDSSSNSTGVSTNSSSTEATTRSLSGPALGDHIVSELSGLPIKNVHSPQVIDSKRKDKFLNIQPDVTRGERLVHRSVYNTLRSGHEQSVEADISISRNIPPDVDARYQNGGLYGSQRRRYRRLVSNGSSGIHNHALLRAADWSGRENELSISRPVIV